MVINLTGAWVGGIVLGLFFVYGVWARFGARIHSRERAYGIDRPFPLTGRLDLVMQEWGGLLVVHDLKTRRTDKIFGSDKLQLALYAFLLRQATGRTVASHAVVRVQTGKSSTTLRRIPLDVTPAELHALADAFLAAAAYPAGARLTAGPALCKRCGFNGKGCAGKPQLTRY